MITKRDKFESWIYNQFIDMENLKEDLEDRVEDTEYVKGYMAALESAGNAYERFKDGRQV